MISMTEQLYKEFMESFIDGVFTTLEFQNNATIQLFDEQTELENKYGMLSDIQDFFNEEDFNTKMFITSNSYTLLIWESLDL